jgi:hypothetical protein
MLCRLSRAVLAGCHLWCPCSPTPVFRGLHYAADSQLWPLAKPCSSRHSLCSRSSFGSVSESRNGILLCLKCSRVITIKSMNHFSNQLHHRITSPTLRQDAAFHPNTPAQAEERSRGRISRRTVRVTAEEYATRGWRKRVRDLPLRLKNQEKRLSAPHPRQEALGSLV